MFNPAFLIANGIACFLGSVAHMYAGNGLMWSGAMLGLCSCSIGLVTAMGCLQIIVLVISAIPVRMIVPAAIVDCVVAIRHGKEDSVISSIKDKNKLANTPEARWNRLNTTGRWSLRCQRPQSLSAVFDKYWCTHDLKWVFMRLRDIILTDVEDNIQKGEFGDPVVAFEDVVEAIGTLVAAGNMSAIVAQESQRFGAADNPLLRTSGDGCSQDGLGVKMAGSPADGPETKEIEQSQELM